MTQTGKTATAVTMIEKKAVQLRHELKHTINRQDDLELTGRLRKLFRHDRHADSHGIYRVSSLYFDTPWDKALREKIDGVNRREKFRLRYYNEDLSFIRLEKKFKINGMCGKYTARLTLPQARQLLEGKIDFLLSGSHPLLTELYSKMKGQLLAPRTVVIYDREAFLYPPGNVRVTIDRNLRAGLRENDFLNPGQRHMDISEGLAVLEVICAQFLPDLVRMAVQVPCRQASAFSKYAACRKFN